MRAEGIVPRTICFQIYLHFLVPVLIAPLLFVCPYSRRHSLARSLAHLIKGPSAAMAFTRLAVLCLIAAFAVSLARASRTAAPLVSGA